MKRNQTFLIILVAILSSAITSYAQHNNTFQNKIAIAKDSASYPNVNTPNHNAVAPSIQGTFDDPKIIVDSSGTKRDNRSKENLDSIRTGERKKPPGDPFKKDTLK